MPEAAVQELIELVARALVDCPGEVQVARVGGDGAGDDAVYELRVAREDLGKVIGKQGRTARALRAIVGAAGHKQRRRITLEIIEP